MQQKAYVSDPAWTESVWHCIAPDVRMQLGHSVKSNNNFCETKKNKNEQNLDGEQMLYLLNITTLAM